MPGTEVVDSDLYAEPAHRNQLLDIALDVLHDQAFGDFQIDARRRNAIDDRAFHHADEVALPQLDRRYVYCNPRWLEFLLHPPALVTPGTLEGPRTNRQDHPRLLEERNEVHRRHQAEA